MSLGPRLYFGGTLVTRLSVIDQYWEPADEPTPCQGFDGNRSWPWSACFDCIGCRRRDFPAPRHRRESAVGLGEPVDPAGSPTLSMTRCGPDSGSHGRCCTCCQVGTSWPGISAVRVSTRRRRSDLSLHTTWTKRRGTAQSRARITQPCRAAMTLFTASATTGRPARNWSAATQPDHIANRIVGQWRQRRCDGRLDGVDTQERRTKPVPTRRDKAVLPTPDRPQNTTS